VADNDSRTEGERFSPGVPAPAAAFPLKGCGALDWGMQSRLARVFRPATSRTVMLAIDHGYFQGPTTGLERVDLSIVPLLPWADALMATRGMIRSTIPPASRVPVVLRSSAKSDTVSRIVPQLAAGDVVTTIKNTVDKVVTEHGVAELRGHSIRQRPRR